MNGKQVKISMVEQSLYKCRKNRTFHYFLKNGPSPASFSFIFVFSKKHYTSYNKYLWRNVMSIQYMVPGFEPTTFGIQVSSHNHQTRAHKYDFILISKFIFWFQAHVVVWREEGKFVFSLQREISKHFVDRYRKRHRRTAQRFVDGTLFKVKLVCFCRRMCLMC